MAEHQITLLPGFEATAHDAFSAEIKPQSPQYQWQYALADHLGNVRVIFTDKNNDGLIAQSVNDSINEVLSIRNYSPFGLELGGSHKNLDYQNPYRFGGKEHSNFTGYSDFGGRWYDSNRSGWNHVDPLAEHPNQVGRSTYSAFWSNPITYNDPDGRCPVCEEMVKNPTDGQIFKTSGATYTFGGGQWTRNGGQLNEVVVRPNGLYGSPALAYTTQTKGVVAGYSAGYIGSGEYGGADANVTGFRAEYNNTTGTGKSTLAFDGAVKITGFQSTANLRSGTENNNIGVGAEGNVLLAEAKGTIGKLTGENSRRGYYIGGEVGAYTLKGEVNPSITILGYKLGVINGGSLGSANVGAGIGGYRDTVKGTYNLSAFISGSFIAGGKLGFEFISPSYDTSKRNK